MSVDRTRLPPLRPSPPFSLPAFGRTVLDNGMRVWTVAHSRAPVLTLRLLVPVGARRDPAEQAGLAALTADLLDDGTAERTDVELHEALTRIGAHLGIETSSDATVLTLTTLPRHARRALELLTEVATVPRFSAVDCQRVRDLRLTRVRQLQQVPSAVADRVLIEALYPSHPYGHLSAGTEDGLAAVDRDDVVRFHQRWYEPASWTLVAVGDLPETALAELSGEVLGSLQSGRPSEAEAVPSPPAPQPGLAFVAREGAVQSEVRLGHAGPPRASPDYHALRVLNAVLGGQFVSRVNVNLREDKGYTYGARTVFDWRLGQGPFSFRSAVQTGATAAALQEVVREIREIRDERPVTAVELEMAQAALTLGFPASFETATQVARAGTTLALHGLDADDLSRFVPRIEGVDLETLGRVAAEHLQPDRMMAVVVGSPDVLPELAELGFGAPNLLPSPFV